MSTANHTAQALGLLRKLRRAYGDPPAPDHSVPPPDPLWHFVYAFLLWDSTAAKADQAMKRVAAAVVDLNELRVCFPEEIGAMLGERYPRVGERAMRLRAALNDIYIREHAVTLEKLKDANKREARQYLSTLDGAPPFVASRVLLLALGGHAIPVDERLLARLVGEGVVEPDATVEKAASLLERVVKAGQGAEAHWALQRWSEEAPAPSSGGRGARKAGGKPKPRTKSAPRAGRRTTGKKSARETSK